MLLPLLTEDNDNDDDEEEEKSIANVAVPKKNRRKNMKNHTTREIGDIVGFRMAVLIIIIAFVFVVVVVVMFSKLSWIVDIYMCACVAAAGINAGGVVFFIWWRCRRRCRCLERVDQTRTEREREREKITESESQH